MNTETDIEYLRGESPRKNELSREEWQQIVIETTAYSKRLEGTIGSLNKWLSTFTIIMCAFAIISLFLYCISIKQRTEILNLQDALQEKTRIIKQYKTKINE